MDQQTSSTNSVSKKRIQRCGNCGQLGHNKRSCRVKVEKKEDEDIKPLIEHEDSKIANYKKLISNTKYNQQIDKLNKIKEDHKANIINNVYEHYFINNTLFNHIDDFTKYFKDNHLENEYTDYNLWYENQSELAWEIIMDLLKYPETYHFPITAPCGSGKTMLMDCLAKTLMIMKVPENDTTKLIMVDNIFVFTGYSSKDWIKDMKKDLKIIKSENVFHRDTIKNLKELIIKDNKRLLNAVFFIDEARLVVKSGMTIDKFFKELGLDKDVIIKYNIKIFYIDATLDSHNISLKGSDNVSDVYHMEPGENYLGVIKIKNNKWFYGINDYNLKHEVGFNKIFNLIETLKSKNKKKHLFRITDPKTRNKFIKELNKKGYTHYLVDSSKESHKWGEHSFDEELCENTEKVTVYILKDMYRCAKRFRLNEHIGIIYEQDTPSDPITTQGLIARFFGYYPNLENIRPYMICNTTHFEHQIYELQEGKPHPDYVSSYVKGGRLLKNTWTSVMHYYNENKKTIQNNFNDGFIISGSICKGIVSEDGETQHDIDLLYNDNIKMMDRYEVFNTKEEVQKRYKKLTTIDCEKMQDGTCVDSKLKMNSFGCRDIFSNMSNNKDEIKKKFNDNNKYIEARIYNYMDDDVKKYALRWIAKR